MSDKRINSDEPGDPRVSEAYRAMADERTPEHLDHVVLNAARSAAKPRWNRAAAWLRPAAWVATIGVCLAIVIEITLLPHPEPAEFDSAPPPAATPASTSPAAANRPEKTGPRAAQPAAAQPVQKKPASVPAAYPEGRSDEAEMSNRARELQQKEAPQEGTAPAMLLQSAPATSLVEEAVTERYCDDTAIADPNTWLECILELERQGLHEAARLERERLALEFPPAELP